MITKVSQLLLKLIVKLSFTLKVTPFYFNKDNSFVLCKDRLTKFWLYFIVFIAISNELFLIFRAIQLSINNIDDNKVKPFQVGVIIILAIPLVLHVSLLHRATETVTFVDGCVKYFGELRGKCLNA